MTDTQVIEEFEGTWKYIRSMTIAFMNCVPEEKLNFSHHPKFAPLKKQFKHMVKVYGCYVDAIQNKNLDMSKKKTMFSGAETIENFQNHLSKLDEKLAQELALLKKVGLENYSIKMFGMTLGFTEFTYTMIQHEVSHFGTWANYAAFGEFETPAAWQSDWKL